MEQSEILARIDKVFGPEKAQAWLHQPNIALNLKTPAEHIQTQEGIQEIERMLSAIAYGGSV